MKRKRIILLFSTLILILLAGTGIRMAGIRQRSEAALGPVSPSLQGLSRWNAIFAVSGNLDQITRPFNPAAASRIIEISQGESAASIAQNLAAQGLISDADIFLNWLLYSGADRQLQPGHYALSAAMSMPEISQKLSMQEGKLLRFAFFSGMRLEEIAALIPDSGLSFSAQEFLNAAQDYPAEKHPCGGHSLEGYLLPGSYEMNRDISLENFLAGFVNEFNQQVKLPLESSFREQGLSLDQGVILASMIAREALSEEEYGTIASVFYNRLRAGMRLESDPTAQYAIGWDEGSHSWWKTPLQSSDLFVNSPYNTYQSDGFPPGAICSPSLAILQAAAHPEETSYLYFMARCDGTPYHNFSTTYAGHAANLCTNGK